MMNLRRTVLVIIVVILSVLSHYAASYILHHSSTRQLRQISRRVDKVISDRPFRVEHLHVMSDTTSVENTDLMEINNSGSVLDRIRSYSKIMYKFSRPHTIKVTVITSNHPLIRAT